MEALFAKVETPFYEGCFTSMLSTMLLLLNLNIVHNVSNIFMDELFSLLKKELLPKNNKMPSTFYEAYKLIKSFGLIYDSIHACVNGCALFRRTLKHVHVCPKCDSNRYVDGLGDVRRKVLKHFPLIPRLIQMYRCKSLTKLLTWQKDGASFDGLFHNMLNSKDWKYITWKWPKFVVDPQNIRLGFGTWWGEPFWGPQLMPFNMASGFATMISYQKMFFQLGFNYSRQRILHIQ